jgi:hypothetical protein
MEFILPTEILFNLKVYDVIIIRNIKYEITNMVMNLKSGLSKITLLTIPTNFNRYVYSVPTTTTTTTLTPIAVNYTYTDLGLGYFNVYVNGVRTIHTSTNITSSFNVVNGTTIMIECDPGNKDYAYVSINGTYDISTTPIYATLSTTATSTLTITAGQSTTLPVAPTTTTTTTLGAGITTTTTTAAGGTTTTTTTQTPVSLTIKARVESAPNTNAKIYYYYAGISSTFLAYTSNQVCTATGSTISIPPGKVVYIGVKNLSDANISYNAANSTNCPTFSSQPYCGTYGGTGTPYSFTISSSTTVSLSIGVDGIGDYYTCG